MIAALEKAINDPDIGTKSKAEWELEDCIGEVWRYARRHGDSLDRELHCRSLRAIVDATLQKAVTAIERRDNLIRGLKVDLAESKKKLAAVVAEQAKTKAKK